MFKIATIGQSSLVFCPICLQSNFIANMFFNQTKFAIGFIYTRIDYPKLNHICRIKLTFFFYGTRDTFNHISGRLYPLRRDTQSC